MPAAFVALLALTVSSTAAAGSGGERAWIDHPFGRRVLVDQVRLVHGDAPVAGIRFVGEPGLRLHVEASRGQGSLSVGPPPWPGPSLLLVGAASRPGPVAQLDPGDRSALPADTYRLGLLRGGALIEEVPRPLNLSAPVVVEAHVEHHLLGQVTGYALLGVGLAAVMGATTVATSADRPGRVSDGLLGGLIGGGLLSAALGGLLLWVSEDEVTVAVRPDR